MLKRPRRMRSQCGILPAEVPDVGAEPRHSPIAQAEWSCRGSVCVAGEKGKSGWWQC